MSARCPLPARASFRDLLRDLVGAAVQVRTGPPQELTPERLAYLAGYRFDDGSPAAIAVCDGPLSLAAGAALGAMSLEDATQELGDSNALEGDLLEFLHEVVNITAKLLNSPSTPHVKLQDLLPVPGEVPEDLAALATEPTTRQDWLVTVDGYGEGGLTLLA